LTALSRHSRESGDPAYLRAVSRRWLGRQKR
jgi:hypothetical protein